MTGRYLIKKVLDDLLAINLFLLTGCIIRFIISDNTPAKPLLESSNCAGFFVPEALFKRLEA